MLLAIKHFFTPPVFPNDEAKTYLSRILMTLAMALLVIVFLGEIAVIFIYIEKTITTTIYVTALGLLLTIIALTKRGHLRLSGILYIAILWVTATLTLYLGSGTSSPQLGLYIALTMTAGILLGVRWAVVIAVVNVLVVLAFALLEIKGYPFPQLFLGPPLSRWFNFSIHLFLTITPVYLLLTNLSEALSRTRHENQQRTEVERRLSESERKFTDIANNIPGLVFQLHAPEHGAPYYSYVSPGGQSRLDLQYGIHGPDHEFGANIHPEDKPAFLDSFTQAAAQRSTWHYEGRLLNRQGDIVWIQGIASPIPTEDGLVFDGVFLDVTERKELEEQFRHAQKMEAIGLLAGGIAHDFNNSLVPIIGYTDMAMMKLAPDDRLYGYLKQVQTAAARAASITQQILAFSRKQVLETRVLDINAVVTKFKQMVQPLIGETITLEILLASDLHQIKADQGQLEQVLMNLAVNARDAMPQGGTLTITTSNVYLNEASVKRYAGVQATGNFVMLAVSDTGHGIAAATQKQIFEPFFTTKAVGEGTGLGLATVFGIVKQHGGNICVDSAVGEGATFKIYFPQAERKVQVPDPDMFITQSGSNHGREAILIVEDERMVRNFVYEVLTAHGYEIMEAQSPAEGLRLATMHKEPIHLLLADVIMPIMDGCELYHNIAALHPAMKVLYISGYADTIIAGHGILAEGANFLQKPFTVESLTQKVREVLG